ncbi:methionine adenosyltransferase [Candidatus Nanohaloarchaea archaeon]|nr:methionine adenosyltransferase [Candidatus Nanohaloarchaea archaeon]
MNISRTETQSDPVKNREVELVERKGLGHPDSICDGIAEKISRELSREYRDRFGHILHHNTDEAQLVAGESNPEFNSGEVIEPIFILLTGRATKQFEGEEIPVDKIALDAAKEYIEDNFKALDPSQIEFKSRIGETSTDLAAVYEREQRMSNDTSFGVGHAPLSPAEKTVKQVEKGVRQLDQCGEDVKVMGLRQGEGITLTVAAPAISSRTGSMDDYRNHIENVRDVAERKARENGLDPEVHVNTADDIEEEEIYMTVTGTSAEMGDDGSVGRGNRVNGLITPHRSMSMEAASGKNPVTHVGKIYNLLSREIAKSIHEETGEYAQVKMLSQIGAPIDDPKLIEVETPAEKEEFQEIIQRHLDSIDEITKKCVENQINTF